MANFRWYHSNNEYFIAIGYFWRSEFRRNLIYTCVFRYLDARSDWRERRQPDRVGRVKNARSAVRPFSENGQLEESGTIDIRKVDWSEVIIYFSKTTGNAHFVPRRDNRWAIRADRCKPNEALTIKSYRTGRSLVSGGNEIVLSVDPPMCFQFGTIEIAQKDYSVNH
jgi:hypothetical protein